jgi:hypothetical protein
VQKVLNCLCISFNDKEEFWQNIKRDYDSDKLNCYEVRPEEIVSTYTDIDRKVWRNQKSIASRRKITQLFEGEIFNQKCDYVK